MTIKEMLVLFVINAALITGYVANIVQVFQSWSGTYTGEEIVKIVGIFLAPLGVVMGYIGFF